MKQRKNVLRGIMVMALVLAIVGTMAGCFGSGVQIVVDQESYTHEYGEIFMVPMATCSDGSEVIVQIFDADGYEVPVEYGTASLEKGEYKMVFTAGTAKKEVPIVCEDTTAPQVFVSIESSTAVGHWITLPAVTADDISGIDETKTKVELYKTGESTPVLTVPGERVRAESVESYTLKVTVADTEGNETTIEKVLKVLDRPESEVLQDFTTQPRPFFEDTWGGGDPSFNWYEEYEGKQGVIGLGCGGYGDVEGDHAYIWWTSLGMDHLDLVGITGITLKYKAENVRGIYIKPTYNGEVIMICPDAAFDEVEIVQGEWTEVYISMVEHDIFPDLSDATIGLAIAPGAKVEGDCVWIDEIIVHYTPYTEYTVTVENGSLDYAYSTVPEGKLVTVKHDNSKTPEGMAFSHYLINGERLWGSSFTVTEDVTLTAVYVELNKNEKPIPEGAVMVNDFSNRGLVEVLVGKGSYMMDISEWYATYEGVAGVRSFGFKDNEGFNYHWWDGVLPIGFDYESYNYITFRIKVEEGALRALWIGDYDAVDLISAYDEWIDLRFPISELKDALIGLANHSGKTGELIWIDQIYVTAEDFNIEITDGTVSAEGNKAPKGTTVTFTHDATKTPAGCEFDGWAVNGVKIEGNTYVLDCNIQVEAVYKTDAPELAIPEGAIMLEDFNSYVTPTFPDTWSTGNEIFKNNALYDGRTGVLALGAGTISKTSCGYYSSIGMNNLNLTELESITFRIKVSSDINLIWLADEVNGDFIEVTKMIEKDQWVEITLPMSAVSHWKNQENFTITFQVQVNGGIAEDCYYIWLDQIYATSKN